MLLLSTIKFYDNSTRLDFFFMWWQACRLSGFTDIPVNDSAWHTDCSRTSSVKPEGTGLIYRVSLLLYWALLRLLHSDWVIHSSRSLLQRLEIDRLELTISYFSWKSLQWSLSSKNFVLISYLKFSRLRTSSISSSLHVFQLTSCSYHC